MPDDIKQRITIDGVDKAQAELKKLAAAEEGIVKSQEKRAAQADRLRAKLAELNKEDERARQGIRENAAVADRRQGQIERLNRALGENVKVQNEASQAEERSSKASNKAAEGKGILASAAGFLTSTLLAQVSAIGFVITYLNEYKREMLEASEAANKMALSTARLAGAVGGKEADRRVTMAADLAAKEGLGEGGASMLAEAGARYAQMNPGASSATADQTMKLVARMNRASPGLGGAAAVEALSQVQAGMGMGMSQQQAGNFLVGAVNQGVGLSTIQDLVRKGGFDQKSMEAMMAMPGRGYDLDAASRQTISVVDSLNRRDERGRLDRGLRRAGITDDMTFAQRVTTLNQAVKSGGISQGKLTQLLGGTANAGFFSAYAGALNAAPAGGLGQGVIDQTIARQMESEIVSSTAKSGAIEATDLSNDLRDVENRQIKIVADELDVVLKDRGRSKLGRNAGYLQFLATRKIFGDDQAFRLTLSPGERFDMMQEGKSVYPSIAPTVINTQINVQDDPTSMVDTTRR